MFTVLNPYMEIHRPDAIPYSQEFYAVAIHVF